jgi:ionotropic glutamate receptor NMDA 1
MISSLTTTNADYDGQSTLSRFQNKADASNIKVESIIEYEPGLTNFEKELTYLTRVSACRVFILYANREDAEVIFHEIGRLNMTSSGYVWIVSEQALEASNIPQGILSLVLKNSMNEEAHIRDSVRVILSAVASLVRGSVTYPPQHSWDLDSLGGDSSSRKDNSSSSSSSYVITKPPDNCSKGEGVWETGMRLYEHLKNQTFKDGSTGRIAFDRETGDRLDSDYDLVNVGIDRKTRVVGSFVHSVREEKMKLSIDLGSIIWPGKERSKPPGFYVPTHLKVVTIAEKPFVWVYPPRLDGATCPEGTIRCPKFVQISSIQTREDVYCCAGYCMDLLKGLSSRLNFTFEVYLVSDDGYGSYEYSSSGHKVWNGMVGDLVSRRADLSVAPLTINPERAKVIDFSKPFKYQGIAMIQRRKPKKAKLESFLQPFKDELWILVFASVFVVASVLYILDRYSPFGRNMMKDQRLTNEKSLNFSSAIWFSFGVLLNSGIGEKTPMSFSARVLGMVWAGFSMIVVASYTANLAAWLVLDTTETEITGLDDPRLRNPIEGFNYGTVKGSFVDMYFSSQVELSNMYRIMEENNVATTEQGLNLVKEGKTHLHLRE